MAIERVDCASREDVVLRAGNPQPVADVRARLVLAERLQVITPRDALRDLPHLGPIEQLAQLRLPDQDYLQQLLLRRFEIRQQAHLLEQLGRKRLRFVDDQDDAPPLGMRLHQVRVQHVDVRFDRAVGGLRTPQLLHDRRKELERRELRRKDQRDIGLRGQLFEHAADQRRLAGADLARELNETATLGDAV